VKYLFTAEGEEALRRAVSPDTLFAFDYDGTLAPITTRYEQTRTPPATVQALESLSRLGKVAIISGRSVSDVSSRLGFAPHTVIGNHGAEGPAAGGGQCSELVAKWRASIEAGCAEVFRNAGVILEDKGYSLSLHYRQAPDPGAAKNTILAACGRLSPPARIFGGKCVVNIAPEDAPDKADALLALTQAQHIGTAIFVGDDENDEAVFERAPAHWLTVRVSHEPRSAARYYLENQDEMLRFIEAIIAQLHSR
jgi:trehalose 6-phosphate phosphatase